MTDTTLGRRIAEQRKLLGLSQEAFGEKMGVSRQAISKWEADAAMPEIEKLITMSKLFNVSVGWLLGTEENEDPKSGNFTDAQIRAIEQITRQYRYEPTPQAQRKWPLILCAIGAALSLVLSFSALEEADSAYLYCIDHINYLNNSVYDLQSQINELKNPPKVESTGAELLMDWQIGIEAKADLSGAYITFTGIPINTQTDDQAYISIRRDGQEVTTAPCSRDSSGYSATVELPAADGYICYFTVTHAGGNSEQQRLVHDELEHLDYTLPPHAFCYALGYEYSAKEQILKLQFDGAEDDICVSSPVYLPQNATIDWSNLELVLYRNEAVTDRLSLTNFQKNEYDLFISMPTACNFNLPNFGNGDEALLYLKGKLTINGATSDFSCRIGGWCMDTEAGLHEMAFTEKW